MALGPWPYWARHALGDLLVTQKGWIKKWLDAGNITMRMDGTLSGARLAAHIDTISGPLLPQLAPTNPDIYSNLSHFLQFQLLVQTCICGAWNFNFLNLPCMFTLPFNISKIPNSAPSAEACLPLIPRHDVFLCHPTESKYSFEDYENSATIQKDISQGWSVYWVMT